MELTKEHFDQAVKGLATQESVEDLSKTVDQIKLTQDNHTMVLGQMVTEKKKKEDKKVISEDRFDRLEHWAVLVGKKLGIKLEL